MAVKCKKNNPLTYPPKTTFNLCLQVVVTHQDVTKLTQAPVTNVNVPTLLYYKVAHTAYSSSRVLVVREVADNRRSFSDED